MLALGGTPARGLVVGATFMYQGANGTFHGAPPGADGQAVTGQVILGALVDWYPAPEGGWHVGGSLGLGSLALTDAANNTSSGGAFGASLLGGYDWWFAPRWSIGLLGIVAVSSTVTMRDGNQNETGYRFTPAIIGVEASFLYH